MDSKYLPTIINEIFIGIVLVNKSTGLIEFMNQMAREQIGAIDTDTVYIKDLFQDPIEGQNTFNQDYINEEGFCNDILVKKLIGGFFIANLSIKFLENLEILIVIQDITVQKKLQRELYTKEAEILKNAEELLKQNQQLRELDKAKDRFFALMSHELRTPISSVIATAQYVHDGLCDSTEEVYKHIDTILDEGKRVLEITNDILDFSKIQAGKVELYLEQHALVPFIQNRIEHIQNFANTKNIGIIFNYKSADLKCYFDDLRLNQVIDNILSNAIKFTNNNGKITVTCSQKDDQYCVIALSDTGAGIAASNFSKVFNEFETVEDIQNHHKGTGLGLPISKKLTEMMGGKIYFESKLGVGTTFYLEIPLNKILDAQLYRNRPSRSEIAA